VTPASAEPHTLPSVDPAPEAHDPAGAGDLDGGGDLDDMGDAGGPVPAQRAAALDERSLEILAFERRWWRYAGAKEQAIRDTFGLSGTRYYQLLNRLLDEPAALAHDPVLVGRLRRLRARRNRSRSQQ
jgi:hypothetical protein